MEFAEVVLVEQVDAVYDRYGKQALEKEDSALGRVAFWLFYG